MSINDPFEIRYNDARGMYYLGQGREAIYDIYTFELVEFETETEAAAFCRDHYGVDPLESPGARSVAPPAVDKSANQLAFL